MIAPHLTRYLAAAWLLANAAAAQDVTASLTALTPLTVTAGGIGGASQTQPAGPLAANGNLYVPSSTGAASSWWGAINAPSESAFVWTNQLSGPASAGSHEILVEWVASSAVDAYLQVATSMDGSAGTTLPSLAVDIGNTGTTQLINPATAPWTAGPFVLGSQPVVIRVVFENSINGGYSNHSIRLSMLPQNELQVYPQGVGCFATTMHLGPAFAGRGIVAQSVSPPIGTPSVLVLGLTAQPLVLPPLFGTPCLLLPRPDVLLPFFATPSILIPLPDAVRPVDLWVQRAGIAPTGGLFTADAFYVRAL